MDITDARRRVLFEQTFGLTKSDAAAKAAFLRRAGVQLVVEQVLLRQKAGSVTLRVAHDADHLRIEVREVGPPAEAADASAEREELAP